MKKVFVYFSAVVLSCCALNVQGQTADNGKQVKRITFDRESICIIYDDNTRLNDIQEAVVRRQDQTTGVRQEKLNTSVTTRDWYTVDGRRLQGDPGNSKGVYVIREDNKVRKVIKK